MTPIGEIARQAGIRTSTVRYYERVGLLPPPERLNGRRRYTDETLDRLKVIRFARTVGFSLGEVRALLAGRPYSRRLREMASGKIRELDAAIDRARAMPSLLKASLACECLTIEECGRRIRRYSLGDDERAPSLRAKPRSK